MQVVDGQADGDEDVADEPPAKTMRSSTIVKPTHGTKPVLQKVCVICSKEQKFYYARSKGTVSDKLIQAATLIASEY